MQRKNGKRASKRKLQLKKETVRTLSEAELSEAAGGYLAAESDFCINYDSLDCTLMNTGMCPIFYTGKCW
jgi:hypothetical protein